MESLKSGDFVQCCSPKGLTPCFDLEKDVVYQVESADDSTVRLKGRQWGYSASRFIPVKLKDKPKDDLWSSQVGGDHYSKRAIQPLQYIMANKLGFAEGNIVKYITRWLDKGDPEENLDKIIDYAHKLKSDYKANPDRYAKESK